ncbi:hypothetical protein QOT17_011261 [Balamuthia mandrillaris]
MRKRFSSLAAVVAGGAPAYGSFPAQSSTMISRPFFTTTLWKCPHRFLVFTSSFRPHFHQSTPFLHSTAAPAPSTTGLKAKRVKKMEERNPFQIRKQTQRMNEELCLLAEKRQVADMFALYHQRKELGVKPDMLTFLHLIRACGRSSFSPVSSSTTSSSSSNNKTNEAERIEQQQYLDQAFGVLDLLQAEGVKPGIVTYTVLLDSCVEAKDLDKAFQALQRMEAAGVKPNLVAFNTLMRLAAANGDLARQEQVFDMIKQRGLRPDVATFNILLQELVFNNKTKKQKEVVDRSFGMLERMKKEAVEPDLLTYRTLLIACEAPEEDEGDAHPLLDRALGVWNAMGQAGLELDTPIYDAFIRACSSHGDFEHTLAALKEMTAQPKNSRLPQRKTLQRVFRACARWGKVEEGMQVLATMRAHGMKPDQDMLASLVGACRERKQRADHADAAVAQLEQGMLEQMRREPFRLTHRIVDLDDVPKELEEFYA